MNQYGRPISNYQPTKMKYSTNVALIFIMALALFAAGCNTSRTAKGAVIGGATGGVLGGVIGKKGGSGTKGAVIGGVIGGTAGAIVGPLHG